MLIEKNSKNYNDINQILSENIEDLIFILNKKFKLIYINEKIFIKKLGYSNKDLINNIFLDFIPPEDSKRTVSFLKKIFKKDKAIGELRIRNKDGIYIWFEINGKKFIDNNRKKRAFLISRDITRYKEREEKLVKKNESLEDSLEKMSNYAPELRFWKLLFPQKYTSAIQKTQEMLETVVDSIPELIYWKDTDLVYIGCNKNYARINGLEIISNIIGKADEDLSWSKSRLEHIRKCEQRVINNNVAEFNIIESWSLPNGNKAFYNANRIPLRNSEEKVVGILTTYEDVTDKKFAEQKLKELNKLLEQKVSERTKELVESEEKFRTIAEQSLLGIIIIQNGFIKYANRALSEIIEYSIQEMKDWAKNGFIKEVHPDDLPFLMERMKQRESGETKLLPNKSITRVITKSNKIKWIEAYSKAILYNGNVAILAVMIDITEKKMAEERLKESERKLREQNIELKKLDKLKNDFITIATHELKTPLISIRGYTDLILTKYQDLKPEIKDDLSRVQRNINRLEIYIEQLMDVMKIDAKKMELIIKRKNIYSLLENCIADLSFQLNEKNLQVNLAVNKDLYLFIDPNRITQAFSNLLSNAIKFTPEFGNIEISGTTKDEKYLLFKVKDSGKGLTENEINNLFGKFVTFDKDPSAFKTGSGLGLYITKGIIEAHGGEIWANSNGLGKGTEFYFTLPINHN